MSFLSATTSTITGTAGSSDSWNNGANWDSGIPTGAMNAIISTGITAQENNAATPAYNGNVTLQSGSTLKLYNSVNTVGNGNLFLQEGSRFTLRKGALFTFGDVALMGNSYIRTG